MFAPCLKQNVGREKQRSAKKNDNTFINEPEKQRLKPIQLKCEKKLKVYHMTQ